MRLHSALVVLTCLAALRGGPVVAQETFQYAGPPGAATWEAPANWTGGAGAFSAWPGQAPEPGTRDSAVVSGSWPDGLTLQITQPGLTLDVLRLGATGLGETVIAGAPGATLTANQIEPAGSLFSTNRFEVDLLLDGDLRFANATTTTTLAGRLLNGSPDASFRTVENATDRTLTVGDIVLSDQAGAPGDLRFVNAGISEMILGGVITDGDAAGGRVSYARGRFEMLAANTYTGPTQLGLNNPNVGSTHVLHTDTPFGFGQLVISGGNELKVIRGAENKGTRTLLNEVQIARDIVFDGSESIVLDGRVFQSNGRSVINQVATGKSLTFNGDIFAADSNDLRDWVFDGPGLTVVNGQIDDALAPFTVSGSSVIKRGSGRVVFTNPAVAAYDGATQVVEGVLQLGDGGAPVGLNGAAVSGGGTLEINHGGSLVFASPLEGGLSLRHNGPGVTRLTGDSTASGTINASAGTLLVDGSTTAPATVRGVLGGSGSVGPVAVHASGEIAPGGLDGDAIGELSAASLDMLSGSQISLQIDSGTETADLLTVAGDAQLGGGLLLSLANGPVDPLAQFTVLTADNLTGVFRNAPDGDRLATTDGGGSFLVSYDNVTNAVVLSDFEPTLLPGDFNADGRVDAADYTIWRDNLGQPAETLANDVDGGLVGPAQHQTWAANYGAQAPSSQAPSSQIPEPAALAAALLAAIGAAATRRRG